MRILGLSLFQVALLIAQAALLIWGGLLLRKAHKPQCKARKSGSMLRCQLPPDHLGHHAADSALAGSVCWPREQP